MKPIRIAVVGCGEIAQVMHLPHLAELPQFEIAALCDLSLSLLESLGNRYGVARRTQDYSEVLDEVEAVAVLTHEHTSVAVAAAEHGKHVFVEKPLGFSIEDCDCVLAAVRENGVKLMVGYMKRFDPGYLYALDRIAELAPIRLVRLHDFGGSFDVHPGIYTLYQAEAPPADESERRGRRVEDSMRRALGPEHEHLIEVYYEMLMSGSHDLTVLRGILGQAKCVLHSELLEPAGIVSVLDYGDGRKCVYEAALMTGYTWWDQNVSVYGDGSSVSIEFPNPFIRYAPSVVTVRRTEGTTPVMTEIPVSYDEAFRREWLHFADCVRSDREPRTNGNDAKADVELALAMVRAIT
jgi:predicted dehydrogenase